MLLLKASIRNEILFSRQKRQQKYVGLAGTAVSTSATLYGYNGYDPCQQRFFPFSFSLHINDKQHFFLLK